VIANLMRSSLVPAMAGAEDGLQGRKRKAVNGQIAPQADLFQARQRAKVEPSAYN
jgi:hypothetical protein